MNVLMTFTYVFVCRLPRGAYPSRARGGHRRRAPSDDVYGCMCIGYPERSILMMFTYECSDDVYVCVFCVGYPE